MSKFDVKYRVFNDEGVKNVTTSGSLVTFLGGLPCLFVQIIEKKYVIHNQGNKRLYA